MPGKAMAPPPWLATWWKTVSPTQRIFYLRKDVKFQDGTPMTADDVVFSFERAAKSKQFRTYTSQAGSARKIDEYAVEFTTSAPNPVATIAIGEIPIMSKAWAQKNNAVEPQDFSTKEATYASRNAMGTGPFRLVSYEPGVKTVLAKNADWWGIKDGRYESNIETIEYRPIANAASRKRLAEAGYPNGFGFTLHCPNDRYVNDEKICTALAAMWARVGLNVKVEAMPKAQYFQRTPKKEFSACMQGWGDNNRDAMFTLKPLYHSLNDKGAGDTNYGNFRNAELDDLIDRAEGEMDGAKRQPLINQAVEVMRR